MSMPKTLDEIKEMTMEVNGIINGVDSPNLMSVDSTEPIQTDTDDPGPVGNEAEVQVEKEKEVDTTDVDEKDSVAEDDEKASADEKNEADETDEKEDEDTETTTKDSPSVAKRIGKLTKNWRTAERERDYEREKRIEAEKKLKELQSQIPDEDRPLREDFDDEDEYIEALTDWKIEQRFKASQKESDSVKEEEDDRRAVKDAWDGLDTAVESGMEKYSDFRDVALSDDLILSEELAQIALDCENPEDIMYYLGSNPDESERISGLDPIRIAKEVGKIEVKLAKASGDTDKKATPRKKKSSAPAPITPIKTDASTGKDPEKMSLKEYKAWRESQSK